MSDEAATQSYLAAAARAADEFAKALVAAYGPAIRALEEAMRRPVKLGQAAKEHTGGRPPEPDQS